MKIALVHDYIKEFGGAERVLEVLSEMYPNAPIYTSFCDKNSIAYERFKNKKIITSWFNNLPFYTKLISPLRFLTPLVWGRFNFSEYDIVISSASWYITKGFGSHQNKTYKLPIEFCYCHTPPRWLYGYETSVNFKNNFFIKTYALVVGHFLRLYDYKQAQKVNYFIANSKEVRERIKKFYKRDAKIIYPPVNLPYLDSKSIKKNSRKNYYLIVSRIAGAKGLELAVDAAVKAGFNLKIAGSPSGYFDKNYLIKKAKGKVEFLGQVSDEKLIDLYKSAKGFLALARNEDFGITPIEAMSLGTPVIAFNGGGYKETVIEGKTGILFNDYSINGLIKAIEKFEKLSFNFTDCINQSQKFSKERFIKEVKEFIESKSKN